jgi:hypothetical protein
MSGSKTSVFSPSRFVPSFMCLGGREWVGGQQMGWGCVCVRVCLCVFCVLAWWRVEGRRNGWIGWVVSRWVVEYVCVCVFGEEKVVGWFLCLSFRRCATPPPSTHPHAFLPFHPASPPPPPLCTCTHKHHSTPRTRDVDGLEVVSTKIVGAQAQEFDDAGERPLLVLLLLLAAC